MGNIDHLTTFLDIFLALNFAFSFAPISKYLDEIIGAMSASEHEKYLSKYDTLINDKFQTTTNPKITNNDLQYSLNRIKNTFSEKYFVSNETFNDLSFWAGFFALTLLVINILTDVNPYFQIYMIIYVVAYFTYWGLHLMFGFQMPSSRLSAIWAHLLFFLLIVVGDLFLDYEKIILADQSMQNALTENNVTGTRLRITLMIIFFSVFPLFYYFFTSVYRKIMASVKFDEECNELYSSI